MFVIATLLLDQVPPVTALVSEIVLPTHTCGDAGMIAVGAVFTVTGFTA
jgi:hypothetical protein